MDKKCAICGNNSNFVDLCSSCEDALYKFRSNPYILLSSIKYLLGDNIHSAKWDSKTHPTQEQSPEQCQEFVKILSDMWQTHLDKNHDYSPANILLTGTTGLVTRIWDKTARLLNLTGFKFKAILHEGVNPPKNPKNESIEDTYRDLTVYGVIGILLLRDKWGK